jgi:rod shape-determining protein MreD
MKRWLYAGLIVGLVPLQTTIWQHVSIAGISPDLCLVATCLVGIVMGEREAILLGLALGALQDLFSPGDAWLNMLTKGMMGLVSGMAGRHLTAMTPVAVLVFVAAVSVCSGVSFLVFGWPALDTTDLFVAIRSILLPQALFDGTLAAGVFWLLTLRRSTDDEFPQTIFGFRA